MRRAQVENVLQAGAPIDPQSGEIVPARLQQWLAGLSTYIAFCDGVVQKALSSSPHARRASPFGWRVPQLPPVRVEMRGLPGPCPTSL